MLGNLKKCLAILCGSLFLTSGVTVTAQHSDDWLDINIGGSIEAGQLDNDDLVPDQPAASFTDDTSIKAHFQSDDVTQIGGTEDNWKISTWFYVEDDDFTAPTDYAYYDFSDGGYVKTENHTIKIIISYSNNNVTKSYRPGELTVLIDQLFINDTWFTYTTRVSANTEGTTGYDWNYSYLPSYHVFKNAVFVEEGSNFEGTIELVYNISMRGEYHDDTDRTSELKLCELVSEHADTCEHNRAISLCAVLNNTIQSNSIILSIHREYVHPWGSMSYSIKKEIDDSPYAVERVIDAIPGSAEDYYWIPFKLRISGKKPLAVNVVWWREPFLILHDEFPEGVYVWQRITDLNFHRFEYKFIENNVASVYSTDINNFYFLVAYPKALYADNFYTTNTAQLYQYTEEEIENDKVPLDEKHLVSEDSVSYTIGGFAFEYSGTVYTVRKSRMPDINGGMTSVGILEDKTTGSLYNNTAKFLINPTANYIGRRRDLKICDDILISVYDDNTLHWLSDTDYYMQCIRWDPSAAYTTDMDTFKNLPGLDIDLYIRKSGSADYELYNTFKSNKFSYFPFTRDDGVVSFYFYIHDLLYGLTGAGSPVEVEVRYIDPNITDSGTLYNFCYYEAYEVNSLGRKYIANIPTEDSYDNLNSKELIMPYDLNTFGHLVQRSVAQKIWQPANLAPGTITARVDKAMTEVYNVQLDEFTGTSKLSMTFYNHVTGNAEPYVDNYLVGWEMFDVLPEGMSLISSTDDIKASLIFDKSYGNWFYASDSERTLYRINDLQQISNVTVTVRDNYRSSGRTYIKISVVLDAPIYITPGSEVVPSFSYSFSATGQIHHYVNYVNAYVDSPRWAPNVYANYAEDSSTRYGGFADINDNAVDETMLYASADFSYIPAYGSFQGVLTYVKSDDTLTYTTKTTQVTLGAGYSYKLRALSGNNAITNLVLYTSLESMTKDQDNNLVPVNEGQLSWQGTFVGVDTSYAENQGYVVKVFYSPNDIVSSLSVDTSWQELTEEVPVANVRSLAFAYLNPDGSVAVLPRNTDTYVEIKMLSPEEEMEGFAYEGYWSEWNALTPAGDIIDFISGIRSNVVTVSNKSLIDLTVRKVWNDKNDQYGIRPEAITISLYKDGEMADSKVISYPDWSVVFEDLEGPIQRYTVVEEDCPLEYTSEVSLDLTHLGIVLTNSLDNVQLYTFRKNWLLDREVDRPEYIMFDVYLDDVFYRTVTLFEDSVQKLPGDSVLPKPNNPDCFVKEGFAAPEVIYWKLADIALPVYDKNGDKYQVRVVEREVPGYENIFAYASSDTWFEFGNISDKNYKRFTVQKEWCFDVAGTRPDLADVTFNLYMYDELVEVFTLNYVTDYDKNVWRGETVGCYPVSDEYGNSIPYRIEENVPEGYTSKLTLEYQDTIGGGSYIYQFKNTWNFTSVSGTKTWSSESEDLPKSITVWLLRNGERYLSQQVSADTNWYYTFNDVPIADDDDNLYIYSVEEEPVAGWKVMYSEPQSAPVAGEANAWIFDCSNTLFCKFNLYIRWDGDWLKYRITSGSQVLIPLGATLYVDNCYPLGYDYAPDLPRPKARNVYVENFDVYSAGWDWPNNWEYSQINSKVQASIPISSLSVMEPIKGIFIFGDWEPGTSVTYSYTRTADDPDDAEDITYYDVPTAGAYDITNFKSDVTYHPVMPDTGSTRRVVSTCSGLLAVLLSIVTVSVVSKKNKRY